MTTIKPRYKNFKLYRKIIGESNSLSSNYIRSIFKDSQGLLWIGTAGGGLNTYDTKKGKYTHYIHDPDNPESIGHNKIRSIIEDKEGDIWIATGGGGLNMFNRNTGGFIRYKYNSADPQSIGTNYLWTLYIDKTGIFWVGTYGDGLYQFDKKSKNFIGYKHHSEDSLSISSSFIRSICEDSSGTLWIATISGLNKFDRKNNHFIHYVHEEGNKNSLSDNRIFSITPVSSGDLWIGTTGGLNKFNPFTEEFTHYRQKHGLPNDYVYAVLEDSDKMLWISTNKGISRFDPREEIFRNYDERDGLQCNEFNMNAFFKSKNGELFFGGINGLNFFFPEDIKNNPIIPPVVFTSFSQAGETIKNAFMNEEVIRLNQGSNFFEFEFAALNFILPEKNQYAYKLEGFDKQWNKTGTRRFGRYTNIPSGNYILRIKGSNNDGIWNTKGTKLSVIVTPPFWRTWWAYTFYILIAFSCLLLFYLYKKRKHIKDLEQKEKTLTIKLMEKAHQQKTAFFINLVHETKTPLTLINNYLSGYIDEVGYNPKLKIIKQNLDKLTQDMINFLDVEKLERNQVFYEHDSIISLTTIIKKKIALVKVVAQKKGINIESSIENEVYIKASAVAIDRILNNLLGNAEYRKSWISF